MDKKDSREATIGHRVMICSKIGQLCGRLQIRGERHDESKLYDPEKATFDKYTPKLKKMTFGSDEYKQCLKDIQPALKHHYRNNSHHPEHYPNGIDGMTLLDIVEMFCDWKAASMRHEDGDFSKSIQINSNRFGMSNQLTQIFKNTQRDMEW